MARQGAAELVRSSVLASSWYCLCCRDFCCFARGIVYVVVTLVAFLVYRARAWRPGHGFALSAEDFDLGPTECGVIPRDGSFVSGKVVAAWLL